MNPRSTGILLVVALLLGAFVYFYEIQGEEGRREAEEAAKRVFSDLQADDIEAVEVTTTDERTARLENRKGIWRVVEPVDFPADEVAADAIASTLSKLTSEGVIDDPQPFATYGLGEDAPRVRFEADGATRTLVLGKKTPVGSNSYVASEGDPRVFMVPTWRLNSLRKSLDELRDRRILRFDRSRVERIAVGWPDNAVVLEKRDGQWWLTSPIEDRADAETVDDLLSELSFLRADGFVDGEIDEVNERLRPPELEVVLALGSGSEGDGDDEGEAGAEPGAEETAGGAPREVSFVLGQARDDGTRLARGSEDTAYTLPAERIDDFARTVVAYRYKELADFESADARRFEITFADDGEERVVEGVRENGGWTTTPENMAAGRASALVSELSRLKADSIAAETVGEQELEGLGLAPPAARFRVYGDPPEEGGAGALLADVSLGRVVPSQGIMARSGSEGPIYVLDLELAEHLPVGAEAFRNRFLSEEGAADELPSEFDEDFTADPAPVEGGSAP